MSNKPRPTRERFLELLYYDGENLRWKPRAGDSRFDRAFNTKYGDKVAGSPVATERMQLCVDGVRDYVARIIWFITYGYLPEQVDHINQCKTDNRLCNLREVDTRENCKNRPLRSDNKTGVTGVFWKSRIGKYVATITTDSGIKHLGQSTDLQELASIRKAAEMTYGYHENHGK